MNIINTMLNAISSFRHPLVAITISKNPIMPIRATIGAKFSGLSREMKILSLSMPAKLKIHAVRVVPIFEPIMTPTVPSRVIIPELTSPTSITVTAEEDCTATVMATPSPRLLKGLDVILRRVVSSLPPKHFAKYKIAVAHLFEKCGTEKKTKSEQGRFMPCSIF